MTLAVVTWKWGSLFGSEYVNRLREMLCRHLHIPFELYCITDDVAGIDPRILVHPMYTDHAEMVGGKRSCFRRLRLLDREMGTIFGPRILQLDLDIVITADVTPLFDRSESVVLCEQSVNAGRPVLNPSMFLFDAGVLHDLWEQFHADPQGVHNKARKAGWSCSDMSIINNYVMVNKIKAARWTQKDGVVAYWREVRRLGGRLPPGARAVLFYGKDNPGDAEVLKKSPWIKEFWL
jgi:hypothetical protein